MARKLISRSIKTPQGRKAKVRYSRWFAPYFRTKKGALRTTLRFITKSQCGVYVIRSKRTRKILYVGHSGTNLSKTMYRHFQSWKDKSQYRAVYPDKFGYEVMVILTSTCKRAFEIEQYYLDKLDPRDGIRKREIAQKLIEFSNLPNPKTTGLEGVPKVLEKAPF